VPGNWQTTLWIMFTAQVVSTIGFAVIFPFLPLYVAELGTNGDLSIAFWAGMVFSSQAVTMAIAAPIWGALADRFGHKLMVERAMFGGAFLLLLMGFARSAEELTLLRALQGAVTGTISAANALVASVAPRDRLGYAMGTIQMGMWAGIAIGPLIGGIIADTLGFRATFIVTAVLLLAAGLLVLFGVKAGGRPAARPDQPKQSMLAGWRAIFRAKGVPLSYGLRFLTSLSQTILIPFTPLFVQALMASDRGVGVMTGLVVGSASAAGTATAVSLGRLGDRVGYRRILIVCALATALFYVPQTFVQAPWQLLVLQLLSGAAWGGITPAISALMARYTASGSEGVLYGLDASIVSAARALAPLIGSGIVVWVGLRGIFIASAIGYLTIAGLAFAALYEPKSEVGDNPS
jgi:DHA1 family multidrug resistance protein-like MFS transporter